MDSSILVPLQVLAGLCEYRTIDSSSRPFCTLLTQLNKRMIVIDQPSEAVGRKFTQLSYLGPFLSTGSLLGATDSRIVPQLDLADGDSLSENSLDNKPATSCLQQKIDFTRTLLHNELKMN